MREQGNVSSLLQVIPTVYHFELFLFSLSSLMDKQQRVKAKIDIKQGKKWRGLTGSPMTDDVAQVILQGVPSRLDDYNHDKE